jgi:hypothetical protein
VAVIVTVVVALTLGAVNRPEAEIVPALADQVTAVFDEPLTVAVNCRVPPDVTVAVAGDTATVPEPAGLTVTVVDADLVLSA